MNTVTMMKNIEVSKGFIILNTFIKFPFNKYSFMKMKTTELGSLNNIKLTHSVSFISIPIKNDHEQDNSDKSNYLIGASLQF